jgi:hypothetical protein
MVALLCLSVLIVALGPPADARAPLLVTVSFDGAGDASEVRGWTDLARQHDARFTYFLSGTYLLAGDRAALYRPPQHRPGASDIGFALARDGRDVRASIRDLVAALTEADRLGMEIGTHFNGHFCGRGPGAVDQWSAADWIAELDAFAVLVRDVGPNNALDLALDLPPITGARSPCFEGQPALLHQALSARGYRYDASVPGIPGWPTRDRGLWVFSTPLIPVAGQMFRALASDYNFLVNELSGAQLRRSLQAELDERLAGDRAPLGVAFHFEDWNDDSYGAALRDFVADNCGRFDVRCVSYRDLATWLDARR